MGANGVTNKHQNANTKF